MTNWKRMLPGTRLNCLFLVVPLMAFSGGPAFARAEQADTARRQTGELPPSPTPEQPRATGILQLPNTMTAPPLTVGGKFGYRVIQGFSIRGFVGAAVSASIGQASGTPYAWGGGVEGFAKRYGSSMAGSFTRQTMSFALESAFHEDPRYFPSEDRVFKRRLLNSLKQALVTRTDAGDSSVAYGRIISAFANGQLVNAWQPASNGRVVDGLVRGVYSLGGDFAINFMQEFIPFMRSHSMRHGP